MYLVKYSLFTKRVSNKIYVPQYLRLNYIPRFFALVRFDKIDNLVLNLMQSRGYFIPIRTKLLLIMFTSDY
jgi:hypothetical protein